MWVLTRWATRSNEAAVRSARRAATDLARRRVEANDVELYLADLADPARRDPDALAERRRARLSAGGRARH
jgi:hypothetical protein